MLPRRFQIARAGMRAHRARLDAHDVTIAEGLPVTTSASSRLAARLAMLAYTIRLP